MRTRKPNQQAGASISYPRSAKRADVRLFRIALLVCLYALLVCSRAGATQSVVAWGGNLYGQLNVPEGQTNFVAIAAGYYFSLGLKTDGTVLAWGDNYSGQLNVPAGLSNVVAIAAGDSHSVALRSNGQVLVWGHNGQSQTVLPPGLTNVAAIATGDNHVLALRSDGTVVAWGDNRNGQTNIPAAASNVVAVAAGHQHSLALLANGKVLAWGNWGYGQIAVPSSLTNAVAIAAGGNHDLALKADGTLAALGYLNPLPPDLTNIIASACGENHGLALRADGTVAAWGYNTWGQVNVPAGLTNVVAVEGAGQHSLALLGSGPPFLLTPLVSRAMVVGLRTRFFAPATGARPLRYQWRLNGTNVPGATNVVFEIPAYQSGRVETCSVVVSNAVGWVVSLDARISWLPFVLLAPPQDQEALAGGSAAFDVQLETGLPTAYQWRFEQLDLAGETNATLRLTNVQPSQAGRYSVRISNAYGSMDSPDARLTVLPFQIVAEPQNQVVLAGKTASFGVTVQSTTPMFYQWRLNGQDLHEATNDTLSFTNVQLFHAGLYSVLLSNSFGSATSTNALLTVLPLGITAAPQSQTILVGGSVQFSVAVESEQPCAYAWRFNGADLPNATNITFALTDVQLHQAGAYSVLVSNAFGTVTSAPAILSVSLLISWGDRQYLQASLPSGLTNVVTIAAGTYQDLALMADGSVFALGDSTYGIPPGLSDVAAIATGLSHSLALTAEGKVVAWGSNEYGQTNVPAGLSNVVAIAGGRGHSLALTADGTIAAWGDNFYGQINIPAAWTNIIAIAACWDNSLALKSDGTVLGWGLSNVVAIAIGNTHAIALKADGTVTTSGEGYGLAAGLSNVVAISAGFRQGLALTSEANVYAWGWNGVGQTSVPSGLTNAVAVSGAGHHSLALVGTGAPHILNRLLHQIAAVGATAQFSVIARGSGPLSYQWQFNGADLPGETNAMLRLTNVQPGESGSYVVVVNGPLGAVTSSTGLLRVFPVLVKVPPRSQTILAGQTATFDVVPQGPEPFSYQWRLTGMDLPGATNCVLTLTNVQLDQAGTYSVAVSNSYGGTASTEASLSVNLLTAWGSNTSGQTNVPSGLTSVVGISTGDLHNVALKSDGTVASWGGNTSGQTNIPSGLTTVVVVAAGSNHSLALMAGGSVVAWGGNAFGQTNVPLGLSNVVAIAAGRSRSLALTDGGALVAWGDNAYGQTNVPPAFSDLVAMSAGDNHTLVLTANQKVFAWGQNIYGQISVPPDLTNVTALAAGANHSLALRADGKVVAWGKNWDGQASVPPGLSNVVAIAASGDHSLALRADGTLAAWGSQTNALAGVSNIIAIAAGASHSLALVEGGPHNLDCAPFLTAPLFDQTILAGTTAQFHAAAVGATPLSYQWRLNGINLPLETNALLSLSNLQPNQTGLYSVTLSNALGVAHSRDALLTILALVIEVPPQNQTVWLGGIVEFAVTVQSGLPVTYQWWFDGTELPGETNSTLALANVQMNQTGGYSVSVSNVFGGVVSQIATLLVSAIKVAAWGGNFYGQLNVPTGLDESLAIAGSFYHCLALRTDGTVVAWGYNASGQTNVPAVLTNVVSVATGWGHSLALKSDGSVAAWGDNYYGQTSVPPGLTNVVAVAAGWGHSLALKSDGRVVSWGWNAYGQTNVPPVLTNAVAVQAGHSHSLALTADGKVIAWGYNAFGQTTVPPDLTNVIAIAAGWNHNLGLKEDGSVIAWGWNAYDQTNVPLDLSNIIAIAAGREHSLALTGDGTVIAWGNSLYGQTEVPLGLPNVVMIAAGGYHSLALLGNEPPARRPTLSNPFRANAAFSVSLPTRSGRVYVLEFKNSLADPNWKALPLAAGNGGGLVLIDPGAAGPQRFYRVRQW